MPEISQYPIASPNWRPPVDVHKARLRRVRGQKNDYLENFPDQALTWAHDVRNSVEDIVVNPIVNNLISPQHHYLASPDFLLDHAIMAAPPERSTSVHITPKSWTRALVTMRTPRERLPPIQYNGQRIRYIMGKGNSQTGKLYGSLEHDSAVGATPWGFFGLKDAQTELEVGKGLLDAGFRASLPLGILVLSYPKLVANIEYIWRGNRVMAKNILANLEKVKSNGDQPAILVRGVGSNNRITDGTNYSNFPEILESLATLPNMSKRTIATLRSKGVPDVDAIGNSMSIVVQKNMNALRNLDPDLLTNYPALSLALTASKDTDPTFSVQDYEESTKEYRHRVDQNMTLAENYRDKVIAVIKTFYYNFFAFTYGLDKTMSYTESLLAHIHPE